MAERIRLRRTSGNRFERTSAVVQRRAVDESPEVGIEAAKLLLDGDVCTRISHRAFNLEPIANNPRVLQKSLDPHWSEPRYPRRIEVEECFAIRLALFQNGLPAQTGLRTFECQELEQRPVVVHRNAPLGVVIFNAERSSCPAAACERIHFFLLVVGSKSPCANGA